jgi:Kelch motif protein
MNPNAQFERDLEQWLQTEAPASAPAGFHATVMDRARTLRQRPGWTRTFPARRLGRGRGITLLAAAALLLVGGALAAGSGLLRLPSVVPPLPAPSVVAVASPDATFPTRSESAAPSASPIPVAGPGGVWIPTGTMGTPRSGNDAVRLLDGRVLVVGGSGGEFDPATAELYDPASGTWSATGNMLHIRAGLPPVLLLDGRVLVGDVVDGSDGNPDLYGSELYDPATGTWSATGPMVGNSPGDTPTVFRDGRVLAVGEDGAEVYDPASGTWTATGKMNDQGYTAAALLSDGRVLGAGGSGFGPPSNPDYYVLDSAQVYDPITGSWTAIANMHAKAWLTAALLQPDGKVLVVGSLFPKGFPARMHAEVYDPATGTWTALAQPTGSNGSNGFKDIEALLSDGTVLMTDPDEDNPRPGSAADCTAAALYDPWTGSTTPASSMLRCVDGSSFTLLLDGTVLKAGGRECNDEGQCISNGAAELYVPAGVPMPPFDFPTPRPPIFPSPTPLPTPLPPTAGPVPPNARAWKVTVDNRSSEPASLFVAEEDENGTLRLVGSATPNVVPAGATVKVTFRFPAKGGPDGWIYVNPRPGEGGSLVHAADIGIAGKIVVTADGQVGWLSP